MDLQVFYPVILLYMVAAFLQGGTAVSMGLLNNIRSFLFIRVSQDAYRQACKMHFVSRSCPCPKASAKANQKGDVLYWLAGNTHVCSCGCVGSKSLSNCRRISVELFSHTLHLDLKFHLMRKTGEITRQLDRGTSAIQNVLSTVVFNIGPSIFDIAAASVYVAASLNVWVAIIVFVTMASYIPITVSNSSLANNLHAKTS